MTFSRTLGVVLVVLLLGAGAYVVYAWESEIGPVEAPAASTFDRAVVARGADLARIGNCITCHTAEGGVPFAGGRGIATPFGVIYGTNITPEPDTGIGRWSQQAFVRAMREGVARDGRHLYPAFPYDHFRLSSDEDLAALYAYLMTRPPVQAEAPANELGFPFNVRALLAGWKLLAIDRQGLPADATQGERWNRGAYLVHGLAHCGSCHTPRNLIGAEQARAGFAGGVSGAWDAPGLGEASLAPVPWSEEQLFVYLRRGVDDAHSAAAGPMQDVVHNLAQAPEEDVRAIAAYIASLGAPQAQELAAAGASREPAELYQSACAGCHRGRDAGGALHLSRATELYLERPRNLLNIIRDGIVPREGESGPWMPRYRGAFTDAQLIELANALRTEVAGQPAWEKVEP